MGVSISQTRTKSNINETFTFQHTPIIFALYNFGSTITPINDFSLWNYKLTHYTTEGNIDISKYVT